MKALKFSASWCGPCKMLTKNLESKGIKLAEYDIDDHTDLAAKYGVRSVPTIVFTDNEGNKLEAFVGAALTPQILDKIGQCDAA
jgi:thioredoxin 1